jgi:hypothetical protein
MKIATNWGMFGIRVKIGHKNFAKDFGVGKTAGCTVTQVCVRSRLTPIRAEASVREWSCQAERQQTVFTGVTRHESSVREGLRFWTDFPVAGNYTYPEHTPASASAVVSDFWQFVPEVRSVRSPCRFSRL